MENGKLNKIAAAFVFLFSFIVYYLTISPTVSFWDCGEFIACSYRMAVPHPPGAPLYLLVGRIFSLIPVFSDIGMRVNLFSTLSSALTVMFLYLTIVIFIKAYMSAAKEGLLRYIPYVGGIIGSLTFAFTTSFWFNAVEAEVYAASMLFTSLVVWMIMYWSERSEEVGNEKYLLVIMYLVGLAIGVHLLNVLALPMVFLIIYYKKYPLNALSFFLLVVAGALLTGIIYPGIVKWMLEIAEHYNFIGLFLFILLLVLILWYVVSSKKQFASLLLMSVILVILGYSTYATIYIRSNLNPNIDENDPETIEKFISYMNREQYGDHNIFDREGVWKESPNGKNYTSVSQFFWKYQVNHMYNRYFGWNFLGKDESTGRVKTLMFLGVPFFLGMFGAGFHFYKNWKYALGVFVLFFMTGYMVILYLNQPDPQPRERDYSYVGSFFAFAIWIGIGAAAAIEWCVNKFQHLNAGRSLIFSAVVLLFAVSPLQVLIQNYPTQDRSGNYVAWDYSYNMLVTCDQDGVIYTNGDNDTFPLWYLQEVEYIRTDVRVANLSLLNTSWYVHQLKHHAPTVPISISDKEIQTIMPQLWPQKRTIEIDIPPDYLEREVGLYRNSLQLREPTVNPTMSFELGPKFFGRYLRVQDFMILNTLYANKFQQPLYFAVTVSRDNMLDGLQRYLRMDGLGFRITAIPNWQIHPDILYDNLMNKYLYRNLNNPDVYYDYNIISLLQNYRSAFVQLANHYATFNQRDKVKELMVKLEEVMPPSVIPYTNTFLQNWITAYEYYGGVTPIDSLNLNYYQEKDLEEIAKILYNLREISAAEKAFREIMSYNPANIQAKAFLVDIYGNQQAYDKAIEILEEWVKQNPSDISAQRRLEQYRLRAQELLQGQ